MTARATGLLGILTTISFFVGFAILFVNYPKALNEVNNLSIVAFNVVGWDGRAIAVGVYCVTGVFSILFCINLFRAKNDIINRIGAILLLTADLVWISFGLFPYQFQDDLGIHLFLIRIASMLFIATVGLIVVAASYFVDQQDPFLKISTLVSGLVILVFSTVSIFTDDASWVRTNLSLIVYFTWFGLFSIRLLRHSGHRYLDASGQNQSVISNKRL
jgi:uncharacterized membrane protein SirB2